MSRTRRKHDKGHGHLRRISVRAVRRNPPDVKKLSRALIQLAIAEAAADAAAQAEHESNEPPAPGPQESADE